MTLKIAMTGLKAASADLASTSNNIANASTIGFKRSSVNFGDVFSAGGTGSKLGMGVKVVDVAQQFAQGKVTATDNQMDLSIVGEGFFRMNVHGGTTYTRAGSFGINNDGQVVNGSGYILTGYPVNEKGQLQSELGDLRVDATDSPPKSTSMIELNMNLDTSSAMPLVPAFDVSDPASYNHASSTAVFDSLGSSHLSTLYFRKLEPNVWSVHTFIDDQQVSPASGDRLEFTAEGKLFSINNDQTLQLSTNTFTPEDSNVDITQELVKIIGTQRNYQANAQIISVSDQMTQTVMNIRR